ncbi:MAG: hypothetical protein OXB92_17240, partial [Acidimicrobiaceae bacterium]|nr:hypothetical protein [Acidimicrobiaceae bacterium]
TMVAGEQERFEFFNSLVEALGEDVAHKLMDSLPPFSWDQVATKDDLNALATSITAKFDQVDAQFKSVNAQFESVNAQFELVAAEFVSVRGELSKVEGNLSKEIAGISKKIADQTRIMVMMMAGFSLTVCAAIAGGVLFA